MIALIDADSILHIVAYNYRDIESNARGIEEICNAVNSFIDMICTTCAADYFVGAIGPEDNKDCFRYDIYKYAPYKGNRPPSSEWVVRWKPFIRRHMTEHWGFITPRNLEADDVIATMVKWCLSNNQDYVICSPDKDMRQLPGTFYDYRSEKDQWSTVNPEEANYNFWVQVITGDATDNIKGVPKLGPIKSKALLKDADPIEYGIIAKQAYINYFGEYYGPIIYEENYNCIKLHIKDINNDNLAFLIKYPLKHSSVFS